MALKFYIEVSRDYWRFPDGDPTANGKEIVRVIAERSLDELPSHPPRSPYESKLYRDFKIARNAAIRCIHNNTRIIPIKKTDKWWVRILFDSDLIHAASTTGFSVYALPDGASDIQQGTCFKPGVPMDYKY